MKRIFYTLAFVAMSALSFVACDRTSNCECEVTSQSNTTYNFVLVDYEGGCDGVNNDEIPSTWQDVLTENSHVNCQAADE